LEYENNNRVLLDSENLIMADMREYMSELQKDSEIRKLRDASVPDADIPDMNRNKKPGSKNYIPTVRQHIHHQEKEPWWKSLLRRLLFIADVNTRVIKFPADIVRLNNMTRIERLKRWLSKKIDKM
jgi:hypothetical protein